MYRYQIQKGAEERVFTNCRRISVNVVESDEELNSPFLTLIEQDGERVQAATQMTAAADAAPQSPAIPQTSTPVNEPVSPTLPPANSEQTANTNKEAN